MPQIIDVPGQGQVEFPDGMTDAQIVEAIKKTSQPEKGALRKAAEVFGPAEANTSLLTGAISAPLAGLAGIAGTILPGPAEQGKRWTNAVHDGLTYQPRTDFGQTITRAASAPFEWLASKADDAGTRVLGATGSPMLATAAKVGVESLPMAATGAASLVRPIRGVKPAAAQASERGFTMTPGDMEAGAISRAAASMAGEPRLARHVSQKNQPVFNEKISKDLGLPPDTPLDIEVLQGVRKKAHGAYESARSLGNVSFDEAFTTDLNRIVADRAKAESAFGGKSPITDAVDQLRIKGADADAVVSKINSLRKDADTAFANRNSELGKALKSSAEALEQQLIRHAEKSGQSDAVKSMKGARTLMAKTYMAESSLKGGNINPQTYATALQKRKPLSGGALEVAEFADNFPRSALNTRNIGETGATAHDAALALLRAARGDTGGLVADLVTLGARPAIRGALASRAGQAAMMNTPEILEAIRRGQASPLAGVLEMGLEQ